jgi:hypothetical protein
MNGNGGNDISKVYNFISELINFENKEINLEFLSEDFYDELLNVETGINYEFTYENYEKLIQLYLTGISVNMKKNNNEKAKGFAIRAINFLSNSECIKLIKDKKKCEKNENLKISKVIESEKLEIEKKQNNLSKRKIEINLIKNNRIMQSLNNKNNKNLIKSKLNEYYQNIKNGKSLLNKELDKQIKSFEIKKRHKLNKKNNQKKEIYSNSINEISDLDDSRNSDSLSDNFNYNKKIIDELELNKINKNFLIKNKNNLFNLKNQIDDYIINYSNNIYDNNFIIMAEKIKSLYNEKYLKYYDVHNEYYIKIKNIEFLLSNDDDINENEINDLISSMRNEEKEIINKINQDYSKLINEEILNTRNNNLNNCSMYLQEKMKCEIFSQLNKMF